MERAKWTPEPPAFALDDPGLRWRREGQDLCVSRSASLRAVLFPVAMIAVMMLIAYTALRDGDRVVGGFMLFALLFPGGFLWARVAHRAEMTVGPDGVQWAQTRPRPFHGAWRRDRIDGLRIQVHPRSRWLEPRQAHVEMRVDGSWKTLVFSGPLRRAERFAEAVALVTGLVPDRIEAEA